MALDVDNDVIIINTMTHVPKYDINFETKQFFTKDFPSLNSPA